MSNANRREFLRKSIAVGGVAFVPWLSTEWPASAADTAARPIQLGLCTYQWGLGWDLPTLIAKCEEAQVLGVELRTQHKHGVEPSLGPQQRREVKRRFAQSSVTLVGIGSNQCFDSPDPAKLKLSIEGAKAFLQLSHDCGASGTKVKPNDFHPGVPHEKTIEQIGRSLNTLGKFAADLGQQVRLEVHGTCAGLPTIKQIMDIADHPSVAVCWNCNAREDLAGEGLEYSFNLVKDRLGATLHIHELAGGSYPYAQLFKLLAKANYKGWALLECSSKPKDAVAALRQQRAAFDRLCNVTWPVG
jgi:sugar phosphate isomerase/epimerase